MSSAVGSSKVVSRFSCRYDGTRICEI